MKPFKVIFHFGYSFKIIIYDIISRLLIVLVAIPQYTLLLVIRLLSFTGLAASPLLKWYTQFHRKCPMQKVQNSRSCKFGNIAPSGVTSCFCDSCNFQLVRTSYYYWVTTLVPLHYGGCWGVVTPPTVPILRYKQNMRLFYLRCV